MDARVLRSRTAIRRALVDLLDEKPYQRIAVKDIVARAGVSKATFYNQFTGKNDVAQSIAAEALARYDRLLAERFDGLSERRNLGFLLDRMVSEAGDTFPVLMKLRQVPVEGRTVAEWLQRSLMEHYRDYVTREGIAADDVGLQAFLFARLALGMIEYESSTGARFSARELAVNFEQLAGTAVDSVIPAGSGRGRRQ